MKTSETKQEKTISKITKSHFILSQYLSRPDINIPLSNQEIAKISSKFDSAIDNVEILYNHVANESLISTISTHDNECLVRSLKERVPPIEVMYLYIYASEKAILKRKINGNSFKKSINIISSIKKSDPKAKPAVTITNTTDKETLEGAKLLSSDAGFVNNNDLINYHDLRILDLASKDENLKKALSEDSDSIVIYSYTSRTDCQNTSNYGVLSDKDFITSYKIIPISSLNDKEAEDIVNTIISIKVQSNQFNAFVKVAFLVLCNNKIGDSDRSAIKNTISDYVNKLKEAPSTIAQIKASLKELIKIHLTRYTPLPIARICSFFDHTKHPFIPSQERTRIYKATHGSIEGKSVRFIDLYYDIEKLNTEVINEVGNEIQKAIYAPIEYKTDCNEIQKAIGARISEIFTATESLALLKITKVVELPITDQTRVRIADLVPVHHDGVLDAPLASAYRISVEDTSSIYDNLDVGNPVVAKIVNAHGTNRYFDPGLINLFVCRSWETIDKISRFNSYTTATSMIDAGHKNAMATSLIPQGRLDPYDTNVLDSVTEEFHSIFSNIENYSKLTLSRAANVEAGKLNNTSSSTAVSYPNPWNICSITNSRSIRAVPCNTESMEDVIKTAVKRTKITKPEVEIVEDVRNSASTAFYLGLDRMATNGKPFSISPYGGKEVIEFSLREIKFNNLRLTASNFILTYPNKTRQLINNRDGSIDVQYKQKNAVPDLNNVDHNALIRKCGILGREGSKDFFAEIAKSDMCNEHIKEIDKDFVFPKHKVTNEAGEEKVNDEYLPLNAMFAYIPTIKNKKVIDNQNNDDRGYVVYKNANEVLLSSIYTKTLPNKYTNTLSTYTRCASYASTCIAAGVGFTTANVFSPLMLTEGSHFEFDNLLRRFLDCILMTIETIDIDDEYTLITDRFLNKNKYGVGSFVEMTSGTIGLVQFRVSIKLCAESISYYINGHRIKKDEIREVLQRAMCFQTQEAYDKFLEDVSKLSLKARDMISKGITLYISSSVDNLRTTALLEFDKTGASWELIIRDKDGKEDSRHKVIGGISKFTTRLNKQDFSANISDESLFNLLSEQIPTLEVDKIAMLMANGITILNKQIARSRKLLEDTAKATKAVYQTISYGNKRISGYKVQGTSGTEYLIACELGDENKVRNSGDHGSDSMGAVYALPTLRRICIVDTGMRDQSGYDMIVNRLLAMANDSLVVTQVMTLREYVK